MPIYSFSTKTKKPQDTEEAEKLKDYCDKTGMNFSAIIIALIKEFNDGQTTKV